MGHFGRKQGLQNTWLPNEPTTSSRGCWNCCTWWGLRIQKKSLTLFCFFIDLKKMSSARILTGWAGSERPFRELQVFNPWQYLCLPHIPFFQTISNIIQSEHWAESYPMTIHVHTHDVQMFLMSKCPWCLNVRDVLFICIVVNLVICGHFCQMWSHLSHMVTLVTYGHICKMW